MTIRKYQTRDEWLAARKDSIGGSDLPALYGFGNRSALAVQLEKLGQLPPMEPSRRYRVGLILEPMVAEAARQAIPLTIPEPSGVIEMITDEEIPHAHASPDRWGIDASGPVKQWKAVVSLKTWVASGREDWAEKPPTYTLLQLQHELMLCAHLGVEVGYITVMGGLAEWDQTFGPYEPNRKLHERLRNEIPIWWQRHIVERRPLEARASDADMLRTLYPQSKPLSWMVLTGEAWQEKYERMERAKALASQYEAEASDIESQFKQAMQETEIAVVGDVAVKWKSSERKGYTVAPTVTRTFRTVKIPKEIQDAITRGDRPTFQPSPLQLPGTVGLDAQQPGELRPDAETGGGIEPQGSAVDVDPLGTDSR